MKPIRILNPLQKIVSLSLAAAMLLAMTITSAPQPVQASPSGQGILDDLFGLGLPELPIIDSLPLHLVQVPSREDFVSAPVPQKAANASAGLFETLGALIFGSPSQPVEQAASPCPSPTIDLKLLIIATDPTDTNTAVPAIKQILDYQGTPYTVFTASPRPTDPNANRLASLLSNGCHAFYQGVILGNGQVAYADPSAGWQSALTNAEWQSLWTYEQTFNIRQVTWYTYPTAEYGFNPPNSSGDTTTAPIDAAYTGAAQPVFGLYANTSNPLTIKNVWAYKATPLDGNTAALLQDAQGNALGAVKTYSDGTQNLALTFDGNPNVIHEIVVGYGLINWVTRGMFLGERHIFISAQEDDIFIDGHTWAPSTACGTDPENTPQTYRITGNDLQAFINWQTGVRSQSTTSAFTLAHAFNGEGTTGIYSPDTLTPAARSAQAQFYWINHTYTHENLDNTSYSQTSSQLSQNNAVAQQMGFTNFNTVNLVTPDISGLSNPNALQAMWDNGVRYVVSDTSRAGMNSPSPNIGIYNQYQPGILMIPRRPNNLFYNVTTPQEWAAEYNCLYASYWGRNLTYDEILDKESDVLVHYLINGEMDPWMFHQTNLRAYDGSRTLLGDLLDRVFAKYNSRFSLAITSPKMDQLGAQMANRMAYSSGGVTASMIPGQSITIHAQGAAVVPVTGLNTTGSETYGGQKIGHVAMSAGQTKTISLGGTPPTATPSPTMTATTPPPTATGTSAPTNTPVPTTTTPPPTATGTSAPTNTPVPTTATPVPTNTPVPNQAPVAVTDSYTMHLLNVVLIVQKPGVLLNDSDPNGDALVAVQVTGPTHGVLILNADGSFTYTPTTALLGFTDQFTYKAYDGSLYSNIVPVTIQVLIP